MFGGPGTAPATGSFEILEAYLSYSKDLINTWVQNDPGTYDVVVLGTLTKVNYTKAAGQEWVFLKSTVAAKDIEGLNTVSVTLKGTAGKQVLVKVNDSVEQWVTFVDDQPITVVITVPAGITGVILFAEGGTAPISGSFDIVSAKVYFKALT
jgi:hypothetical protein